MEPLDCAPTEETTAHQEDAGGKQSSSSSPKCQFLELRGRSVAIPDRVIGGGLSGEECKRRCLQENAFR